VKSTVEVPTILHDTEVATESDTWVGVVSCILPYMSTQAQP